MNYFIGLGLLFFAGCSNLDVNPCAELNKEACNESSQIKVKQNPKLDQEMLQHQPSSNPI